ncbi:hypothetical protein IOC57_10530 [Bacillus sp. SD075]|uniref:hypothetical protein n=1 Tax=Bacillus sp. SD075 TaxID=2781732 RepID=UPI001A972A30|nr:hypothetical protein [Bacillus sp. SD075]MBO0998180.1 hypothetical protein [Bacillus sp. SD075]
MKRTGKLHFLVGILASVLLMAQAVIGIMMYMDGSGNEPINGQAMMGQPAERNTTESANSSTATDDSTTETASNDTQGNMGETIQGGPNGSGTPGEMPNGGGLQGRDSFAGRLIDFYQGEGSLAASIIIFVIGGVGLVTSVISRKIEA